MDTHSIKALSVFIYAFHMPLFIFLSGLTHRKYKNSDSFNRSRFISLLLVYVSLKMFVTFIRLILDGTTSFSLLNANDISWFMLYLAFYEITIYVLRELNPRVLFIVSFLLSLVAGLDSTLGDYLVLSRYVVYMPFFLTGYYLNPQKVADFTRKWYLKALSAAAIAAFTAVCWFKTSFIYAYRGLFTGRNSFETVSAKLPSVGIHSRLFTTCIAAIICFAVICVIPNINIKGITAWGRRTLQVYFWHRPVIYVLVHFSYYELLKGALPGPFARLIYLLSGVVLTLILVIPIFRHPTDELMLITRWRKNS